MFCLRCDDKCVGGHTLASYVLFLNGPLPTCVSLPLRATVALECSEGYMSIKLSEVPLLSVMSEVVRHIAGAVEVQMVFTR